MKIETIGTVEGLDDDEVRTLNALLEQLGHKYPRNKMREVIYDGKHAVKKVGKIIPSQYYRLGLVAGWNAKAVDALGRRCNLESFSWADGKITSLGSAEVWDDNWLGSEINSAITSCLIHATSFLVNVAGEDDEPESLILTKDALTSTGTWNARKRALDDFASVDDTEDNCPTKITLCLPNVTATLRKTSSGWVAERSEHTWGVPVEPLVYKRRTGRSFGSSRITRAGIGYQAAAIRSLIRLEGHMDIWAFPEFWILGAFDSLFKNEDGTAKDANEVRLGRIKGIRDLTADELDDAADGRNARADVKKFGADSPEPHLKAINAYAKLFARDSGLPDSAVAISDMANPASGEAYDTSQYELISEAEGACDDWNPALRRSFMRALAIKNNLTEIPAEWRSINTDFRDPRYVSRAAEADAGSKQLGSVEWLKDTREGLKLLGLRPNQIENALAERARIQAPGTLAQMLESGAASQGPSSLEDAQELRIKFEALGIAARAGVDQDEAAERLGLGGIKFTGVPVAVRQERSEATALEDR